ncbi:hypothetical protein D3C81_816130 [compost metagenome]
MISPNTKDIVKIIRTYAFQNGMTLTEFARKAEVSKSWISRLRHEDAEISLLVAQKMLNAAGYKIIIKHQTQIDENDTKQIKTLTDEQILEMDKEKKKKGSISRLRKVIGNAKNTYRE